MLDRIFGNQPFKTNSLKNNPELYRLLHYYSQQKKDAKSRETIFLNSKCIKKKPYNRAKFNQFISTKRNSNFKQPIKMQGMYSIKAYAKDIKNENSVKIKYIQLNLQGN